MTAGTWVQRTGPRSFDSTDLVPELRDALVPLLRDAHDTEPFTPRDPRAGTRRALSLVESVGLSAITIRGAVDVAGVEVDHIWLAVADDAGDPWVLDPAFPLHQRSFVSMLGGYVAGVLSADDLAAAAAGAGLDDRVVGRFPRGTTYRGEPVWGLARR